MTTDITQFGYIEPTDLGAVVTEWNNDPDARTIVIGKRDNRLVCTIVGVK